MKTRRQTRWITKDAEMRKQNIILVIDDRSFYTWWTTKNNWHRDFLFEMKNEKWLNISLLDCSSVVYVNAFESKPNYHKCTIFLRMSSYSNLAIWMFMQIYALISMFILNILPRISVLVCVFANVVACFFKDDLQIKYCLYSFY